MVRFSLLPSLLIGTTAFQARHSTPLHTRTLSSVSSASITRPSLQLSAIQTDEWAERDYNGFAEWAQHYGLSQENFQISEQFGEWGIVAGQPAQQGSRVLFVPAMLRMTSIRIRQEEFADLESAIAQYFDATNTNGNINLACQFYLFLKVLKEYDQGDQSSYYQYLNALPRKFTTAITFDDFELECLPPFVAFLSKTDRFNFDLFLEVLQQLNIPSISDATKNNYEVTKWAFNVVFTRARAAFGEAEIIPMADSLNHAAEPNVEVQYDNDGNVNVMLLRDVQAGEALFKAYGEKTNPSRFLATYGFFDTSPPATYCKLMPGKILTPELVNLGFVYDRMVFWVEDGGIAEEVWDVMLYTLLGDNDPGQQQQFYDAHMRGDGQTKAQMHEMYRPNTVNGLLQHVDETLGELNSCLQRIEQGGNAGHENLPMIQYHNEFVRETFLKVRSGLEQG